MKRYLQITVVLGFFALLVLYRQSKKSDDQPAVVPPQNQNSDSITSTPSNTTSSSSNSSSSAYKDGTYTGSVADAFYGNLQVQAVISGGKLTDVVFLQYPNDNRTSQSINEQASVYLKQEALQSQNAQVDVVSGASDSSQAFRQSLASALSQAQ